MTDENDERTDEQRYEAGADRARRYFRQNGLVAGQSPASPRRLADLLPKRDER